MRTETTSFDKNDRLPKVIASGAPRWRPETKRRLEQTLGLLMAGGAIAAVYRLLPPVGAEVIGPMLTGLGVFACALGGLGTFLWCVKRGLAWDSAQEEARTQKETLPANSERTK